MKFLLNSEVDRGALIKERLLGNPATSQRICPVGSRKKAWLHNLTMSPSLRFHYLGAIAFGNNTLAYEKIVHAMSAKMDEVKSLFESPQPYLERRLYNINIPGRDRPVFSSESPIQPNSGPRLRRWFRLYTGSERRQRV
jgi:hypothetical protein